MTVPKANKPARDNALGSFYRDLMSAELFVFDDRTPYFQEKLLQVIWNEQLLRKPLATVDGRRIEVVHRGIWNVESGPDFHDAAVFLDGRSRRGAVEIHMRPENWREHGHNGNPDYAETILHVVWENPKGLAELPAGVPLCALAEQLDRPLHRILDELNLAEYPYAEQVKPGSCAESLAKLSDDFLRDLFQSYGVARVLAKGRELSTEIAADGLETAVYRRLMDVMGYKSNRAPFGALAELVPLSELTSAAKESPEAPLAMLLGAGGLLPDPTVTDVLPRRAEQLQNLWATWWSRRREYRPLTWNRHRQRPFNAPERRLAAAHFLLARNGYEPGRRLIEPFLEHEQPTDTIATLRQRLQTCDDEAWLRFYSFERDLERPAQLLGPARLNDLLVNLAVPLFFAWCFLRQRPDWCTRGKSVLAALPKLQGNRLFKEAAHYFLVPPSRAKDVIVNACAQQGLLRLYRDRRGID